MGKRKKWVPDVIWRVFQSQARTLLDTILHLIPHKCSCNTRTKSKTKWRCLRCCFHEDYEDKPVSYLIRPTDPPNYRILLKRSFVVVPRDAPPLLTDSTSGRRWSHLQIVRRTIETILAERPGFTNCKDMSSNVKLLNSSAWDLLSERVGERIMSYILFHAFIFLPIPYGKYQQVAGPPVPDLIQEFRRQTSEPESSIQQGSKRKRRRGNRGSFSDKKKLSSVLPCQEGSQNSSGLSEAQTDNASLCSCCSVFKTALGVPKDAEIKRPVLYNLESSPYLLPKKRILYLISSIDGANFLIRNVFALPEASSLLQRNPCSHRKGFQSHGSACINFSLMKLFKAVISRARHCCNNVLLDKHCPVPIWSLNKHGNLSIGSRGGTAFPAKWQQSNLQETNIQHNKSQTPESSTGRSEMEVVDSQPCLNLSKNSRKRKRSLTSESSYGKSKMDALDSQPCLNKCYNSRAQVVSFVWAACRKIIPSGLLGCPSSWRTLRRNISRFIQLRRFEKFSLKQCMSDLKMSEFPAFLSKCYLCCSQGQTGCGRREWATSDLRHRLFEKWIFWFFSQIVGPIIQANFYVTESEYGKQELYFYRKSVWKKISDHAIATLKEQGFSTVSGTSVRNIIGNRPWGFSKLRICPKKWGYRTIASLRSSSRIFKRETGDTDQCWGKLRRAQSCSGYDQFGYTKSVNHFLHDILPVFRDLRTKKPENWGASVFNYNDVYEKLVPFFMSVKKDMKAMPTPFIVVSDVKKAFDTVYQDKLLEIVDGILMKDEYLLQKSNEIACRKKSLWVYENLRLMNQRSTEIKASGPSRPWNTIVIDQEQSQNLRKEEINFYLQELLKHNVLHVDQCFILQNVGIPQGSALSTLLCSLYLGHLERRRIFPLLKRLCETNASDQEADIVDEVAQEASDKESGSTKYTLLRFTDDFLFLSTSKSQAASFVSRLQIGFGEYNCYMNKDKYCLNFDMENSPEIVSRSLVVCDDGASFIPWGGLLINCHTLEIQADYTKYSNNHLSSTLTISRQGRAGSQLKHKLCDYMRPKCHPIFFDSNINSGAVVRVNIYQAFLLAAMKFHSYVCGLSKAYKYPPGFYIRVIQCSLKYMHKLIRKRMKTAALRSKWKPILELSKDETIWLGRTAYIRVLTKKQARYTDLIRILRSKLAAQGDVGRCPVLMSAVEDSHSSYMFKLEY
ncbi:hypothetical protein V2J09_022213 [Rumex salicifolius]